MRRLATAGLYLLAGNLACDPNDSLPATPAGGGWVGAGAFRFESDVGPGPIDVFYYAPRQATETSPVVVALHGSGRNARGMRDDWIPKADQYGCVVVAPRFDDELFPGGSGYILGNVFENGNNPDGDQPLDSTLWAFSMIEPLFDEVKRRSGNRSASYELFGHSGGGQFVHRFVLFVPEGRFGRAIAANAGWYTVADPSIAFPYGLLGAPVTSDASKYFRRNLVVLIGDQDTDPGSAGLRHTPEADAQGLNRFERSVHFLEQSQVLSSASGLEFRWSREVVTAVGHNGRLMSLRAADLLFAR